MKVRLPVYIVLVISMAVIFHVSCHTFIPKESSEYNQDDIRQSYTVEYTQKDKTTRAHANFSVLDPRSSDSLIFIAQDLQLTSPSNVEHNSYDLDFTISEYIGTNSGGGFQPSHEFVWTDTNGRIYRNSITFDPISFTETPPAKLSLSQGFTIDFAGKPVGENEEVWIVLNQKNSNEGYTFSESSKIGATSVTVTPEQLQNDSLPFPGTKMYLYLWRNKEIALQEPTENGGGSLHARYETEWIEVEIVE